MKLSKILLCFALALLLITPTVGCAGFLNTMEKHNASSVVDYLYPNKAQIEKPSIPQLSLPLRVGIAFVPESKTSRFASHLNEKEKMELMTKISAEFKKLTFVKEIEIIPSAYLTSQGSFGNLDQIRTMHGIDVIALISYDQVQHTDEGMMSIAYWTIVGAYLVEGEKNDTSTMMDAAVYDIASRKMLFRAPGTSHIKGTSTLVNISEQLRKDSLEGFQVASAAMVSNLQAQLELFKDKVKERPQEYVVQHQPGYTGGGSMSGFFSLLLLGLGGLALWLDRKR